MRQRQRARPGGRVEGPLDSTVCHRVVWALTSTYGAVYFCNVIIPPPATTLLKLSACWGKNSVKSPADLDTAEHKQWSRGLGSTPTAHMDTQQQHTLPSRNLCSYPEAVYFLKSVHRFFFLEILWMSFMSRRVFFFVVNN